MDARTCPELGWIDAELAELDRKTLRRRLTDRRSTQGAKISLAGRSLVNFGSNDYLCLSADPRLAEAAAETALHEGVGSGASPLICGHATVHAELDGYITETVTVTATGFKFLPNVSFTFGGTAALVSVGEKSGIIDRTLGGRVRLGGEHRPAALHPAHPGSAHQPTGLLAADLIAAAL